MQKEKEFSSKKNKNPKLKNYKILKTIGEGTFSKVKEAIHIPSGEKVAIKILEKSKIEDEEDLICINREINYLKNLSHPNIISLYETIETKDCFYIIMEYAENDLFSYIVKNNFLNELTAKKFFYQIISSIKYIQKKKITHRDVKPENILLTQNNQKVKLIDFGLANNYSNNDLLSTSCGSPCYAAPEMVLGKKYKGIQIDIWSSGIVLYAMLCGYLPFEDDTDENIYRNVILGKFDLPNRLSIHSKDLIKKILEVNPNKRIKLNDIFQHQFLKGIKEIVENELGDLSKGGTFTSELLEREQGQKRSGIIEGDEMKRGSEVVVREVIKEVINKMIDLKLGDKEYILKEIKDNKFNQVTTSFKLLFKQFWNKLNGNKDNILIEKNFNYNSDIESNYYNNINCNSSNYSEEKKMKDTFNTPVKLFVNNNNNYKIRRQRNKIDNTLKLNSFNIQKTLYNNNKKINFITTNNIKKIEGTLINTNKNIMKNVKKVLSNRGRNENNSFSLDKNSNFNKTYGNNIKTRINNILSSSNLKINSIRLSVEPINRKKIYNREKVNSSNKSIKSKRKKQLSIITSGNTFIDSYENLILNTDKNHKRTISTFPSPVNYSSSNTHTNYYYNESYKKSNVSTLNNITINKKKNNSNNKGKKHCKTINVINNLNLINNNNYYTIQNNEKQKKYNYMKNKRNNYRDFNSNRFLLKTFIEPSFTKNKSPKEVNKKNNKYNGHNTTLSNKNYNIINIKEKSKQINLNFQKFSNITINDILKKGNNINKTENNLRNKLVNSKQDFACFTTKLTLKEIINKLEIISKNTKYTLKKIDNNSYNFYNENNEYVSIEILKIGEKSIINLFHITGNENYTKEIIKNLILEIGF